MNFEKSLHKSSSSDAGQKKIRVVYKDAPLFDYMLDISRSNCVHFVITDP